MFTIEDEGAIKGLAEIVSAEPGSELTDSRLAQAASVIRSGDLPLRATMGPLDDLTNLVKRIWFRKLVRELPEQKCALPWFECHVPPSGTTGLAMKATTELENSIGFKLFGSGLGSGRSVKVQVSNASEPRKSCAIFYLDLLIKPRIYETFGQESVEVEVIKCLGETVDSVDNCPYCGVDPGKVDKFDFVFGSYIDLRKDKVNSKRTINLEVNDSLSIETGFKLSDIPFELELGASVSRGMTLEVEYGLVHGKMYKPYHRVSGTPLQTEMWAIE